MADMIAPSLVPASPLHAFAPVGSPEAGVRLAAIEPGARLSLRLRREDGFAAVERAFGVALSREACRFAADGDRRAIWLGPDEWLLAAPLADGEAIAGALAEALAGVPHSLVPVSHRSVGFAVEGPNAAALLNAGCPLDLSDTAFPPGTATRTVLGKTEILLLRQSVERFEVEVWRSFAAYAWGFLREASRDFG